MAFALGCGGEEASVEPLEEPEARVVDEGADDELCLYGMECYDPSNIGRSGEEIFANVEGGFPAPGSQCPVPEPWGFNKGERIENTSLIDCQGNPLPIHDVICGASVGWVYFYRGPS